MRNQSGAKALPLALAMLAAAVAAWPQGLVTLGFKSRGVMSDIGWYVPMRLELRATATPGARKLPPALKSPLFGVLRLAGPDAAPNGYLVVLDEPKDAPSTLIVDSDADGDLTNDPPAEWKGSTGSNGLTSWSGGAWLQLGRGPAGFKAWLGMYRFDPRDPSRAAYKLTLFYYRDYGYEGTITLGSATFRAVLNDEYATGDYRGKQVAASGATPGSGVALLIDLNNDGRYQSPVEAFDVRKPFNIGGTTWEIADMTSLGDRFRIVQSSRQVAETLPPPNLSVGKVFPSFEAMDMDGKPVRFPADYKGKVVMLDFWATWCGPCMSEVPGLVATWKTWSPRGFDVVSVSLDDAGQAVKVRSALRENGMVWRQVYEGGGWETRLAQKYLIDSIPAAFLVDGDTGIILAARGTLRGSALAPTIEKALQAKR